MIRLAIAGLLVGALVSCLVACAAGPPSGTNVTRSSVRVVTHRDLGGGPAAIVGGRLVVTGDCLAFSWDGAAPQTAVWPRGVSVWEVDGETAVARDGVTIATVGRDAYFEGGMDYAAAGLRGIADPSTLDACPAARYMLINSTERLRP